MLRTTAPRLGLAAILAAAALAVPSLTALEADSAVGGPDDAAIALRAARTQPLGPTGFTLASLNLLGAGHTDGKNPRKGYAKSGKRLTWSMQALEEERVQVVGFQEMHASQAKKFVKRYGKDWGVFPGTSMSERAGHNSIAWRKASWEALQTKTIMIPYFNGNPFPMPYVQLRNTATGQKIWLVNVHNPADAYGDAQEYRDKAVRKEIALINDLRSADPKIPVFLTGDMNDHEEFFCPMVGGTDLASASGGSVVNGACATPEVMKVDWVLGSRALAPLTGYLVRRDELIQKATDHPLITSRVTIPSLTTRKRAVRHVVLLALDGVRSSTVAKLGEKKLPHLYRMMRQGASTLEARTDPSSSLSLPNLTSMVTGTRVSTAAGGHGLDSATDPGGTLVNTAGRYVQSIFERVHNDGRGTSFFATDPNTAVLNRSWDATNGATDRVWVDNGRDKFSTAALGSDSRASVDALIDQLNSQPGALAVAQLDVAQRAGIADGFSSNAYAEALHRLDRQVGQVVAAINASRELQRHTVVVVAGTSGGYGHGSANPDRATNYRVPMIAWGHGVARGADLYALNPSWRSPGKKKQTSGSRPAISTAVVANLALGLLRLPPLSESTANVGQRFTIYPGSYS